MSSAVAGRNLERQLLRAYPDSHVHGQDVQASRQAHLVCHRIRSPSSSPQHPAALGRVSILRGKKKVEVRSFATKIRGPVCLYASFTRGADDSKCQRSVGCSWEELTRGALVGIIEIVDCRELRAADNRAAGFQIYNPDGLFAWLVKPLKRFAKPIAPKAHAQPSFFFPFG